MLRKNKSQAYCGNTYDKLHHIPRTPICLSYFLYLFSPVFTKIITVREVIVILALLTAFEKLSF